MAQDILDHTNTIEASWKCEIQLTASPFEPAKSTEVFFILANATYKGIAHDYGAELGRARPGHLGGPAGPGRARPGAWAGRTGA